MGLPTSKKKVGLGKSLMRTRFKGTAQVNPDGSIRHTTEVDDSTANVVKMQSITQENDLEAFLNTAQLAGTDFAAEKLNITVVSNTYDNPFLLSAEKEKEALEQHKEHKHWLTVPRRPEWDATTTADELKRRENESFLNWRRGLSMLEEEKGLIMTPYERNLEVWRQLWRVIERSDLVVQIVDSRNPVLFRSKDVEKYVREVHPDKKNLLLVNKADMLTVEQRLQWADHFDKEGIQYIFFSAALAKEKQDAEEEERRAAEALAEEMQRFAYQADSEEEEEEEEEEVEEEEAEDDNPEYPKSEKRRASITGLIQPENQEGVPLRAQIWGALELIQLFETECPTPLRPLHKPATQTPKPSSSKAKASPATDTPAPETKPKITIGFVGYPNVGKSSTLNALVGAKKVTVSSTPGKTKHFQTIHLSESMILCDCPGLVFPSFATTKADLVVNGILPIDQLREFTGPAGLVAARVPKRVVENIYGLKIRTRDAEGVDEDRQPNGTELLVAYALSRGFTKASQGNPDEARAARYILKDYVSGKLLYAHPPPGVDSTEFNAPMYLNKRFAARRPQPAALLPAATDGNADGTTTATQLSTPRSSALDASFFQPKEHTIKAGFVGKHAQGDVTRVKLYPHQGAQPPPSTTVTGKASKAHDKKNKRRGKQRTDWTAQEP
ncbi:ribosome biogenesis GTPase Lsg1 [Powellomyces hirtus]|nr:ribosome biogenesis GTPase Lsg1 [Powellomyces hirtus]